ncbi:hypothetical protein CDAR_582381 [Caerostris darwini]|uniref:Uncharacterized protein n=1 Tax=Caerostris darwini TaxID=1538125 RepID=A0AAV4RKD3_9ARAC|nr:hypothetical protein CDAR_582381 [Caerostris darwini]
MAWNDKILTELHTFFSFVSIYTLSKSSQKEFTSTSPHFTSLLPKKGTIYQFPDRVEGKKNRRIRFFSTSAVLNTPFPDADMDSTLLIFLDYQQIFAEVAHKAPPICGPTALLRGVQITTGFI